MKKLFVVAGSAILAVAGFATYELVGSPAQAALAIGAPAPDFTADGFVGETPFKFHLADALKKGPVVLYFFPAAFTSGCTVEAHNFAEAAEQFNKMGATLIGVTAGNTDRLAEFAKLECRSKFPVAGDPKLKIAKSYDATLALYPGHSNRTSYVIGKDGKISAVYSNLSASNHVEEMLAGVKAWRAAHPG